ncbi:pitrilysin family protein [Solwaraspora sp. WMMD406]|uniref:M16 family metallopeptidase n=1 Tax=Solwaraspora sp. WMMD406 TaxID=3016095 RepID=UPI0024163F59|nr:pitrilysin family protein [Solwaraspora sp. WMMD406]MDG4767116.1 pitrilysin family protein [Solwaraspora sp. WMMD406]
MARTDRAADRAPARPVTRTLTADPLGGAVRRTVLPNGLRVITEAIPGVRSVSFGVWVGVGSRDETPARSGASHFLEHLLFKGTRRRTAWEISSAIEAVGGETNAFTAKEYTCYYARVLDDDLPMAIDVMCDLVANSVIDPADVETERGVILEEIAMHDDEPDDEVHDLLASAVFGPHPLGRLISGTEATISALTRRQIHDFYRRRYTPGSMVIAAAGNLDHRRVVRQISQALRGSPLDPDTPGRPAPVRPDTPAVRPRPPKVVLRHKETEQAHLVVGGAGISRRDDRRFALGVLNNVLGGGMSSRLFQEIRERRGLAYSVYSYASQYADGGAFAVYAGCAPGKVDEVLELVRSELAAIARDGVTADELARGKGMSRGGYVLGLEDTGSRMGRLAKGELLHGGQLTVDQLLARVAAVTRAEVDAVAADLLTRPMSLAVIGPVESAALTVRRPVGPIVRQPVG